MKEHSDKGRYLISTAILESKSMSLKLKQTATECVLAYKERMDASGYSLYTKLFDIEFNNKSFNMNLFPFELTRRDKSINHTSIFHIRISFAKNYSYITIKLFVFIQLGIDFHK